MFSPDIQNDLHASLTSVLLDHVKHEVENASCYVILADEVKYTSKLLCDISIKVILEKELLALFS